MASHKNTINDTLIPWANLQLTPTQSSSKADTKTRVWLDPFCYPTNTLEKNHQRWISDLEILSPTNKERGSNSVDKVCRPSPVLTHFVVINKFSFNKLSTRVLKHSSNRLIKKIYHSPLVRVRQVDELQEMLRGQSSFVTHLHTPSPVSTHYVIVNLLINKLSTRTFKEQSKKATVYLSHP